MRLDRDGNCAISSAGHPAPFLNKHEMNLPGALPLGIQANTTYEETMVRVGVGDHFALYTDGLLEARSESGELYSFARLETLFAGGDFGRGQLWPGRRYHRTDAHAPCGGRGIDCAAHGFKAVSSGKASGAGLEAPALAVPAKILAIESV